MIKRSIFNINLSGDINGQRKGLVISKISCTALGTKKYTGKNNKKKTVTLCVNKIIENYC